MLHFKSNEALPVQNSEKADVAGEVWTVCWRIFSCSGRRSFCSIQLNLTLFYSDKPHPHYGEQSALFKVHQLQCKSYPKIISRKNKQTTKTRHCGPRQETHIKLTTTQDNCFKLEEDINTQKKTAENFTLLGIVKSLCERD